MTRPLPFSVLLDALRAKGLALGVREHIAWMELAARIDAPEVTEWKYAAVALLAKSPDEAQVVALTFDELFTRQHERAALEGSTPAGQTWTARARAWVAQPESLWWLLAVAFVSAALGLWAYTALTDVVLPPVTTPRPVQALPYRAPAIRPTITPARTPAAPPARPELPPPPRLANWTLAAATAGLVLVLALTAAQRPRARAAHRQWVAASWKRARAQLPGPHWFTLRPRQTPQWFDRRDIEDAATILARAFTTGLPSTRLDERRTIGDTLRSGTFPRLVFRPSPASGVLLLLQDVGEEMRLWGPKVDALIGALARQGIAIERYYFEDTPARVWPRPLAEPVPFERLKHLHAHGLLIIGTGRGLADDVGQPRADWVTHLTHWARRSWLHPVNDRAHWRGELRRLPLRVWPLMGEGIIAAAHDLAAGARGGGNARLRARLTGREVLQDDVERLKRVVALASHPSAELIESLRQRFVPDVPADTVLHVMRESTTGSLEHVKLPAAEVRRLAGAARRETPERELLVRSHVRRILLDTEPPTGTLAHQRWQLALASQDLALAEAGQGSLDEARTALRALSQGPIWNEVGDALEELREVSQIGLVFPELRGEVSTSSLAAPSALPSTGEAAPRPWAWLRPQWRDIAAGLTAAALVSLALQSVGAFQGEAVAHVEGAYQLDYVAGTGLDRTAGLLRISRGPSTSATTTPATVRLVRGNDTLPGEIAVPPSGFVERTVSLEESGAYFQLQSTLPAGNLALSSEVFVPSMSPLVSTTIDAAPWASVRILDPGTQLTAVSGEFVTPFVVNLQPGRYTLELRHPDYGLANGTIDVQPDGASSFRFALPGFDAERTLQELLGVGSSAAQTAPRAPASAR